VRRYVEGVIRFRWAVLAAVLLITALSGVQISRGVIGSSLVELFFGESEDYAEYERMMATFGASDVTLVAFESDELFSAESIDRLDRIVERLEANDEFRSVQSFHVSQSIDGDGEDLIIKSYGDLFDEGLSQEELRARVLADDLIGGLLVAPDGKAAAVAVVLEDDPTRKAEDLPKLVEAIFAPFLAEGWSRDELHMAGLMPESSEVVRMARSTLGVIFPFSTTLLLLIVFALFRRMWRVTITGGVALISVTWTVAFAVFVDRQISLLIAAVPAVTGVVCFSDIIHLCSAYILVLKRGVPKHEAIVISSSEVGTACVFTSMTTFVGFASLAFVPAPAFRQLGLVLAFGVATALLLAVTLVPIAFTLLPEPKQPPQGLGRIGRFVDGTTFASMRLATSRPKAVIAAFAVFAALAGYGISQIEIETDFVNRLDEDNALRKSRDWITERFVGTNVLDVYVDTKVDEGALQPSLLKSLFDVQREIEAHPAVDKALSMADVVGELGGAMNQGRWPESSEAVSQYLLLFEMADDSALEQLIDDDRRYLRLSVRLNESGFVRTAEVGKWVGAQVQAAVGPKVEVKPSGLSFLFGDWMRFIIEGQRRGLMFAIFSTTIMMLFCVRSIRVGLLSMIPNLLPLAALGGYMGLAWDKVDTDVALVAMIAIGIGVDDTVHFLTRFRLEALRSKDLDEAIERTFLFTGRAIVQTTVILCAGFLPFVMSSYFSTQILGTLLPLTLVVALVADLLLVPALAKVGVLVFRR